MTLIRGTQKLNSTKLHTEIQKQWNDKIISHLEIVKLTEENETYIPNIKIGVNVDPALVNTEELAKELITKLITELNIQGHGKTKFNSCIVTESIVVSIFDQSISSKGIYGPMGYYTGIQDEESGEIKEIRAWIVMRGFFE